MNNRDVHHIITSRNVDCAKCLRLKLHHKKLRRFKYPCTDVIAVKLLVPPAVEHQNHPEHGPTKDTVGPGPPPRLNWWNPNGRLIVGRSYRIPLNLVHHVYLSHTLMRIIFNHYTNYCFRKNQPSLLLLLLEQIVVPTLLLRLLLLVAQQRSMPTRYMCIFPPRQNHISATFCSRITNLYEIQ